MPKAYPNRVLLTLSDEHIHELDALADEHNLSRVALLRCAVELFICELDDEDVWLEVARGLDGRAITVAPGVH